MPPLPDQIQQRPGHPRLFLWSSQVVAAAAKHQVASLTTWFTVETVYFVIQFALVGLALGLVYGYREPRPMASSP